MTDIHGKKRFIFYLNIDHFYTAVEERENLALKGKPVVVGANPKEGEGHGVVSKAITKPAKQASSVP